MGDANSRDPPLIHNCSADAMAHGSRWWRRCYGTRSQMVAQMERQKEKREREDYIFTERAPPIPFELKGSRAEEEK